MIGLIERFYNPDQGSIEFEGVDLTQLKILWYRDQIGIVSQEPSLFSGTIGKDIAYGYLGATQKEIGAAAIAAYADSFIWTFPKGYKTELEKVVHNFQVCNPFSLGLYQTNVTITHLTWIHIFHSRWSETKDW